MKQSKESSLQTKDRQKHVVAVFKIVFYLETRVRISTNHTKAQRMFKTLVFCLMTRKKRLELFLSELTNSNVYSSF